MERPPFAVPPVHNRMPFVDGCQGYDKKDEEDVDTNEHNSDNQRSVVATIENIDNMKDVCDSNTDNGSNRNNEKRARKSRWSSIPEPNDTSMVDSDKSVKDAVCDDAPDCSTDAAQPTEESV